MERNFKFIGFDVRIADSAIINQPHLVSLYNHIAIDAFFYGATQMVIGNYVHISTHVSIIGGKESLLILEDFSFIASGSRIVCGSEDYSGGGLIGPAIPKEYKKNKITTIKFEKFSGCGVNCSIMPGVTLAEGSVLGANSLLTKSTEPWGIYIGSPAKLIGIRDKTNIYEFASKLL